MQDYSILIANTPCNISLYWKQKIIKKKFDNFVFTGGSVSCHYDNLRCHQWWQRYQIGDFFFLCHMWCSLFPATCPQPALTCVPVCVADGSGLLGLNLSATDDQFSLAHTPLRPGCLVRPCTAELGDSWSMWVKIGCWYPGAWRYMMAETGWY